MLTKIFIVTSLFISGFAFSFAQSNTSPDKFLCLTCAKGLIDNVNQYIVVAIGTLLLAVSVVGFFLGVVRFIWAQQNGNEKGVASGKQTLLWGLIALFCAFSVYGIISFGQSVFFKDAKSATNIVIPRFIIDKAPTAGTGSPERPPTPAGPGGAERPSTRAGSPGASNPSRPSTGVCGPINGKYGYFDTKGKCVLYGGTTSVPAPTPYEQYNTCISNGGGASACQQAFEALGGSGNALGQTAYVNCINNGGSVSDCQNAYNAILGNGKGDSPQEPEPAPYQDPGEVNPCDTVGACDNH